jgi:hypothetical protein
VWYLLPGSKKLVILIPAAAVAAAAAMLPPLLCCQVVIVEEAAEVLEAHILTSMSSKTEHLILIGERLPCWYAHARVTAADSRSTDHL